MKLRCYHFTTRIKNAFLLSLVLGFSLASPFAFSEDAQNAPPSNQAQPADSAAEPRNLTVLSVRVQGNQVVNTNTILNKISIRKGVALSQDKVNEDIKRLYATNFFKDIRFDVEPQADGLNVIVVVDEKPVVKQINIVGAKAFKENKLRKEIKVLEGQILDERLIVEGVQAIEKKYTDKGFRFVKTSYDIRVNEEAKEATITVNVEEGVAYRIKEIKFAGVQSFQQRKLKKLMRTKSRNPWLLFKRNVLKESVLKDDVENINIFYQDEGFLDAKVVPEFEYDEKVKQIAITLNVEEGARYQAGAITMEGNKVFPEHEIWQRVGMLPGTTYSQRILSNDLEAIRKFYFSRGYMDVRINPDVKFNRDVNKVDVHYTIEEGDLFFVDKVKIRGNTKTKDIVIRRELRINPGARFDGDLLDKSKQRLTNLGYFEEVTYDTEPGSAPNRKDIVFRVKEKQTGELSFGGGYSSIDQFIGFAEIAQRNFDLLGWPRFTGGGQSISLRGRIGSISKNVEFSFVEPYLFNKRISFQFDAYNTRFESRNIDFAHERRGAGVTFAHAFNDFVRAGTGYVLERVKVFDIEDSAADIIREVEGSNILSRLKLFVSRDTTDNAYNPTKGSVLGFSSELVGTFLGGDQDYYILQASGVKYWTFRNKHVIEWRNRLATSDGLSSTENVPVFDRFFAGGLGTVRGYNYRRVSPKENERPIGGETLLLTSIEHTFPVPQLDIIKGSIFIDAGEVNMDSYEFFTFDEFVVSIGPGLKISTPIGPFALYYGFPIFNRDTENRNGRFEFSLSRSF